MTLLGFKKGQGSGLCHLKGEECCRLSFHTRFPEEWCFPVSINKEEPRSPSARNLIVLERLQQCVELNKFVFTTYLTSDTC